VVLDVAVQIHTLHQFHHQVSHAFVLTCIVGRDDIGVHQSRGRFDFPPKSLPGVSVLTSRFGKDFDGNRPIHLPMPGPQHHSHSALPKFVLNKVRAKAEQFCAAIQDFFRLKFCQSSGFDQIFRSGNRIPAAAHCLCTNFQFFGLCGERKTTFDDDLQKFVE